MAVQGSENIVSRQPGGPAPSPLRLAKVEAIVLRAPVETPVQTSFGIMYDRPAVLVRIEDRDGMVGWGEIWCNFPGVGAEHRARVLASCVAPILLEQEWDHPQQAFELLSRRLHVLGIQSGEPGTMAQAIAGADIALWDLAARRAGQPLWQLLGRRDASPRVPAYASGLSPTRPEELAAAMRAEGFRAFKLKVGFGVERDLANMASLRALLGAQAPLMVDANQAWTPPEAVAMSRRLAEFNPAWLEEPIAADASMAEWQALAKAIALPLAAGENMRGAAMFSEAIASGAFAVIQPDLGKWGGFSGCLPVAREALFHGRLFCPHWLGGGIGLIASIHLKAAAGGPGYVEVDSNPNPLRTLLATPMPALRDGAYTLTDGAGLGAAPDMDVVREYLRRHD
ncbi:mandelate racemase/muconate lactonizing enzyme family protein [Noviherbaspirillum suwonense]|uniref:L-alanine-DL-glutamate epimerase n=1 Tax=Noviherbaspirillum suwonense TaxID=1224511 RepID=A0ABY1Q933_9BURK|nr:mandelate racemase/muconate lactonizing enzyme family protein [Noviherbaspirillum suwonense]SMP63265.1 L-alanine-DL-glutamate epimerase [Noviherbaspirillum suwonense]